MSGAQFEQRQSARSAEKVKTGLNAFAVLMPEGGKGQYG